jgi:capsular polysaccharide transport system permease protein
MYVMAPDAFGLWAAFKRQRRVVFALMLRDIRTRFFGSGLGYLLAIAWPLSHILIVVAILVFADRVAPYGDNVALFVATGALPFMIFSYLSRFMMISVFMAKPLLAFPAVKLLDILIAAALLETLAACSVTLILIVIGWFVGLQVIPIDLVQAAYAFGAAALLGVGCGMLNGVIALAVPFWMTGYALIIVALWMTAGIFFVPDVLPEPLRWLISWHPVAQAIEWMRSAYYGDYQSVILDRGYLIAVGVGTLFAGLLLERTARGHLLVASR